MVAAVNEFLAIQHGATWCFIILRKASEWADNRDKPHKAIMRRADGTMHTTDIHDVRRVPGARVPMERVPADITDQLREFLA